PYFLELRTYRFRAHSMYDPELYRSKDEVERWKQRDPIDLLTRELSETGTVSEQAIVEMEARIGRELEAAVAFAEEAALEPVENLTRFVYSEPQS
ncbi:MAG: thiamine pyrophosphate-dependent enzyme, partial [Anaerolineaceae bacterium]